LENPPTFHADQLRPYHEDPKKPNFTNPPPDLVQGEQEWEVEEILDSVLRNQLGTRQMEGIPFKRQYLVTV
jgi:hypothetical protein